MSSQGVILATGQLPIDRPDLLGNVGEGFVEELRASAHRLFEIVLGFPGVFPRLFKVLFCASKFVFYALETLHRTCIRRHLVEFAIETSDFVKQFFFKFLVGILIC